MTPNKAQLLFHHSDQSRRACQTSNRVSPDRVLLEARGEAYADYRRCWQAAGQFEQVTDWPLHLDVDTNCTCNLRCIMCPLGQHRLPNGHAGRMLDLELYRRTIREGVPRGLASIRLGITGEPLLRKDILEFIHIAREAGLPDIMLITNGVLLTEAMSEALIDSGLTRLMVSIDAACPETYERIRPGGNYAELIRNLNAFLDIRSKKSSPLPLLRVSFIKMSQNERDIDAFREYWEPRADYLCFQEYANILEFPETAWHVGPKKVAGDFRCPDPWQRMSLFANGDLFPCCSDFGRLEPLGNANERSLGDVWLSDAAQRLRELHQQGRWMDEPVCRRCVQASVADSLGGLN